MSRQQHNDWRALNPKPVNHEAIVENPMAEQVEGAATAWTPTSPEKKMARADDALSAESEARDMNETAVTPRPSNWDSFTPCQKYNWRKRNKANE